MEITYQNIYCVRQRPHVVLFLRVVGLPAATTVLRGPLPLLRRGWFVWRGVPPASTTTVTGGLSTTTGNLGGGTRVSVDDSSHRSRTRM